MDTPLSLEASVFEKNIEKWRKSHEGQVVLIKGEEVIGFYPSVEQAFRVGTGRFGLEPFLVRQIVPADAVNVSFFGRRINVA